MPVTPGESEIHLKLRNLTVGLPRCHVGPGTAAAAGRCCRGSRNRWHTSDSETPFSCSVRPRDGAACQWPAGGLEPPADPSFVPRRPGKVISA